MKRRLIALLLCIAMIGSMTVYAVGDDPVCTCGTETEEHAADCALLAEPAPEPETEEIPVPETKEEETPVPETEEEETPVPETEEEETPDPETETELTPFQQIMAGETTEDMYLAMLALMESDMSALNDLSFDQIQQIEARLLALDPEKTSQDTIDALDTLTYLPNYQANAACPDCEQVGEHAEDCPRVTGVTLENKSGTIGATTISSNTTWTLTGNVTLTGTITIKKGATLKIYNDNHTERTIKRGTNHTGDMFYVEEGATLHINGDAGAAGGCYGDWSVGAIVVDGNRSAVKAAGTGQIIDCSGKLSLRDTVIRNNQGASAIWLGNSGEGKPVDEYHFTTVEITRCLIENNDAGSGGGILIAGSTGSNYKVDIWNSKFYKCTAVDGSAIYFASAGQADVIMRNCVVDDCDQYAGGEGTYGGAIRTNGNGRFKFTMRDSVLRNCHSWKFGGGIYWNASGAGSALVVEDCQFLNNSAVEMGGAMFLEGSNMMITATAGTPTAPLTTGFPGDICGTLIQGNDSPYGGGICYKCYSNSKEVQVPSTVANFNSNVIFKENTGTNGAALAYALHNTHNYPTGATFEFNINGAEFSNNVSSGTGGAMYIEKCRDDYVVTVNFNSGTISNNSAVNGGAIAIKNASGVTKGGTVNMNGGTLADNTASANGGALYVQQGTFNMKNGTVKDNVAVSGGAAYIGNGVFNMDNGTLASNDANNGGAIFIADGTATINDGQLVGNTATNNGGALYVNGTVTMNGGAIGGSGNANTAVNGGGVYVNGGNFNMVSGSLLYNEAESHGGGAFAHNGNVIIGVADCNANGTNHSNSHSDKKHPEVINNTAVFGGGLAVDGGNVDIYCGKIITNNALNNGTGMNIFMYDSNTSDSLAPVLNHHNGTVGEETNHGMVVIGGTLNVNIAGEKLTVNYHGNDADKKLEIWVSEAPESYYLNLPYCPQDWEDAQNNLSTPLTFVGWTYDMDGDMEVEDSVDLSFIRDKNDYRALGDPIEIKKVDWKENEEGGFFIDFYAVWAPITNDVSYEIAKDNYGNGTGTDTDTVEPLVAGTNTTSYKFSHTEPATIRMTTPSVPGYTFLGWKLTPSKDTISNWNVVDNAANEEVIYLLDGTTSGQAALAEYGYKYENGEFILTTDRNFGDIKLTALFQEQTVDYTFTLVGPEAATNFGKLDATKAIEQADGSYKVTVGKVTGDPGAATATPEYGFKLKDDGWFIDATGITPANDAWVANGTLTPGKVNDLYAGGDFYAIIEYHLADMIITKTASGFYSDDQTFIFEVYQGNKLLTTVALQNNEAVTIKDLTIGTQYTVKEVGSWSWRFDKSEQTHEMVPAIEGEENTNIVSFVNTQLIDKWLTHDTSVLNKRSN